jgi:hypothetical protein
MAWRRNRYAKDSAEGHGAEIGDFREHPCLALGD